MTNFKARPTVYKGIEMRSRLEAGFAQWLDSNTHLKWEYEPCAFATEEGQYLPDFRLSGFAWEGRLVTAYVEVKPANWFADDDAEDDARSTANNDLCELMGKTIWPSEPEALLLLAGPGKLYFGYTDNPVRYPAWPIPCSWIITDHGIVGAAMTTMYGPWLGDWWKPRDERNPFR